MHSYHRFFNIVEPLFHTVVRLIALDQLRSCLVDRLFQRGARFIHLLWSLVYPVRWRIHLDERRTCLVDRLFQRVARSIHSLWSPVYPVRWRTHLNERQSCLRTSTNQTDKTCFSGTFIPLCNAYFTKCANDCLKMTC